MGSTEGGREGATPRRKGFWWGAGGGWDWGVIILSRRKVSGVSDPDWGRQWITHCSLGCVSVFSWTRPEGHWDSVCRHPKRSCRVSVQERPPHHLSCQNLVTSKSPGKVSFRAGGSDQKGWLRFWAEPPQRYGMDSAQVILPTSSHLPPSPVSQGACVRVNLQPLDPRANSPELPQERIISATGHINLAFTLIPLGTCTVQSFVTLKSALKMKVFLSLLDWPESCEVLKCSHTWLKTAWKGQDLKLVLSSS